MQCSQLFIYAVVYWFKNVISCLYTAGALIENTLLVLITNTTLFVDFRFICSKKQWSSEWVIAFEQKHVSPGGGLSVCASMCVTVREINLSEQRWRCLCLTCLMVHGVHSNDSGILETNGASIVGIIVKMVPPQEQQLRASGVRNLTQSHKTNCSAIIIPS